MSCDWNVFGLRLTVCKDYVRNGADWCVVEKLCCDMNRNWNPDASAENLNCDRNRNPNPNPLLLRVLMEKSDICIKNHYDTIILVTWSIGEESSQGSKYSLKSVETKLWYYH